MVYLASVMSPDQAVISNKKDESALCAFFCLDQQQQLPYAKHNDQLTGDDFSFFMHILLFAICILSERRR